MHESIANYEEERSKDVCQLAVAWQLTQEEEEEEQEQEHQQQQVVANSLSRGSAPRRAAPLWRGLFPYCGHRRKRMGSLCLLQCHRYTPA